MADRSKIEWTDASWNPIRARHRVTGRIGWHCEHVSEGCRWCYAERMNARLGTALPYRPATREIVETYLDDALLRVPLRWKKPRKIFVGSMTDVFADFVTDAQLDTLFAVMALTPRHTYQVLTKRPERARAYLTSAAGGSAVATRVAAATWPLAPLRTLLPDGAPPRVVEVPIGERGANGEPAGGWQRYIGPRAWPLSNVWLGTSVEDQAAANARIPALLATPATLRFLSCEPLLGPVDLQTIIADDGPLGRFVPFNALAGRNWATDRPMPRIDWVIAGGESGPRARPMHPAWARSLRDQCAAAGVPFFFKQWGEWAAHDCVPGGSLGDDVRAGRVKIVHPTAQSDVEVAAATGGRSTVRGSRYMARVGKRAAGAALDGVVWRQFPAPVL